MKAFPPLASLRAFEAAARHLSFKHAAAELGVTPTAVSHQIRLLEGTLGTRLFERKTRQVDLTVAGHQLFPVFRDAFSAMSAALDKIRSGTGRRSVTISATTAFSGAWLVARTREFNKSFPDITLRILPSDVLVDLQSDAADCAIRYGRGPFPGLVSEPLFEETFVPVCSPRLNVRTPEDLRKQTLLHSVWYHQDDRTPSWGKWCARAGLEDMDTDAGTVLAGDNHVIQSAIAGQGVALLSAMLARDSLDNGLLTQPFGPELEGHGYHFIYPPGRADNELILAVRSWLHTEIAAMSL